MILRDFELLIYPNLRSDPRSRGQVTLILKQPNLVLLLPIYSNLPRCKSQYVGKETAWRSVLAECFSS